jgi:copper homeostasis protein
MSSSPLPPERLVVELCAGGIEDVYLAAQYGVDRIELNAGMAVGGLTPSAGLIAAARRAFPGPVVAMIRPREGGFAYSKAEYLQMLNDSEAVIAAGIEGIAAGFLSASGSVDVLRCRELRALLPDATLVFHRAFDVTADFDVALSQLIDCGFNRILTSGGMPTALEGAAVLKHLKLEAAGKIEILPAGGIRAASIIPLIEVSGCNQIHSAVRETTVDFSTRHNSRIHFGLQGCDNGSYGQASANQLQALLRAVKHLRSAEPGHHDA